MNRTTKPSTPFSNGTEYEIFMDTFCNRCANGKTNEAGFPAFPEEGGCPTWDAMENARFDESLFPQNDVVRLLDGEKIVCFHACTKFHSANEKLMRGYQELMKGDSEDV